MRAMWKGSVSFGLVNVPVKMYAATEDHDVRFHQVHAKDGGRIKMKRTCSLDGEPVEYAELAKAYETETGQVVVMDESDFADLPVPGVREIDVLEFVPTDQVDPLLYDRAYYLEPDARAVKPYALLREALASTDRTAITKVVIRSKTQLAALRVRGDVLVLQTMLWPDEVRAAEFDVLDGEVDVRPQELAMAASLVENLSADFDPSQYRDEYREALLAVIERKLAGGAGVPAAATTGADGGGDSLVVDLMAALRESVERTKAERAAADSSDGGTPSAARTASGPKTASGARNASSARTASSADEKTTTAKPKRARKAG